MTDQETITNKFNENARCRQKPEESPKLQYEPGCSFIECEHADCRCRMNDGDGGPLSAFIARWQARHA